MKVNRITKLGLVVYLIGGPPRCGKSVLARRLTAERAIPFIPTDLIWAVIEVSQPEWRTPMHKGPDRIPAAAKAFEPYLVSSDFERAMADAATALKADARPA